MNPPPIQKKCTRLLVRLAHVCGMKDGVAHEKFEGLDRSEWVSCMKEMIQDALPIKIEDRVTKQVFELRFTFGEMIYICFLTHLCGDDGLPGKEDPPQRLSIEGGRFTTVAWYYQERGWLASFSAHTNRHHPTLNCSVLQVIIPWPKQTSWSCAIS